MKKEHGDVCYLRERKTWTPWARELHQRMVSDGHLFSKYLLDINKMQIPDLKKMLAEIEKI
ncbi:MAG: hypothetical protein Q8M92_01145 [Candidatus Subteraquimicrobiales bacterium]|nr:hypothetical protein [Candidatus Subteraquimicrobiales bacterium]